MRIWLRFPVTRRTSMSELRSRSSGHPILADRLRATRIALGGLFLDERITIPDRPIAPRTALRRGMAIDDSDIHPLGLTPCELFLQRVLCRLILREPARPRGIAIDAMDDVGTAFTPRPEVQLDQIRQRGFVLPAWQWDRQQARRLVGHEQFVVFVDDAKRIVAVAAGSGFRAAGTIHPDSNAVARRRRPEAAGASTSVSFTNTPRLAIASVARPRDVRREGSARNLSSRTPASVSVTVHVRSLITPYPQATEEQSTPNSQVELPAGPRLLQ